MRLVRWPGVLTAAADAATASWLFSPCAPLPFAAVTSAAALLYAGGVVLNDVADASRDATIHPERPLPSGEVTRSSAALFGSGLMAAGLGLAFLAGVPSFIAFVAVGVAILLYDFTLKRVGILGAVGMGLCRGGSVLAAGLASTAGFEMIEAAPIRGALLALPWFLHALFVTLVSLLEESPNRAGRAPWAAAAVVVAPALGFVLLGLRDDPQAAWAVIPWLILVVAAARHVETIRRENTPRSVGMLVREGVFGFLLLDAALLASRGRLAAAGVATGAWLLLRLALRSRRS